MSDPTIPRDPAQAKPPKTLEDRRIATTRVFAGFVAALSIFYLFQNFKTSGFVPARMDLPAAIIESLSGAFFVFAFSTAQRLYAITSYLMMVAICIVSVLVTLLHGSDTGSAIFLLMIGPIAALIIDTRRPYAVLVSCFVAASLYCVLEYLIPRFMDPRQPLLMQLANSGLTMSSLRQVDIYLITNVFAVEFGIGLCSYMAMRWATIAEAALMREHARSEMLLRDLLPPSIAERLKDHTGDIIADRFDAVTILFADVVNFTQASAAKRPEEVIGLLSRLFGEFDVLAQVHGLEKIKTIGDCYMVAGGMPERSDDHPQAVAAMALDMLDACARTMPSFDRDLSIRIGMHTGPVMAGVIGNTKPYYDVWGDTVNIASRMESSGLPGRIQVTAEVRRRLEGQYRFSDRGIIDIKGKGPMQLSLLDGRIAGDG